jgi:transposase InsO family protein
MGSCFGNAAAESFNSTIKVEYIHRHRFATRTEARTKIATWIVDFCSTRRRHTAAGGLPPAAFELIINEACDKHDQEHLAA